VYFERKKSTHKPAPKPTYSNDTNYRQKKTQERTEKDVRALILVTGTGQELNP